MWNVLLLKGQSQYNAMRYYIDEIELGFRLAGFHTIVVDMKERSVVFQLEEIIGSGIKIDFIFDCNAIGTGIKGILSKLKDTCYLTYLCDHPVVHDVRLKRIDGKSIVFTCDALHEEYIRQYYPNIKFVKFIPLSGSCYPRQVPFQKRKIDVVFTGSYINPGKVYEEGIFQNEDALKVFAEYMLKDIIENPKQTVEMCLGRALEHFGVDISKKEFCGLVQELYFIDRYAKDYYRERVIRILLEHGIKVHVFGNGWEGFDSPKKENLIIEKGNSYVARKALANAKISLNVMPWFKAGFQERIAAAMLSGAVAVTDKSQYIDGNFEDGKELVVYSLEQLEELPGKIKELLQDVELAGQIAAAGKDRAEREMTWQHRAFEMLAYIQQCLGNIRLIGDTSSYGKVLQIPYRRKQERWVGLDAIQGAEELLELMEQISIYDVADVCDMEYLYSKFLTLYIKVKANFPQVAVSTFVYNFFHNLKEENLGEAIELFIMECTNFQSLFLKAENNAMCKEIEHLKSEQYGGAFRI